MKNLYLIFAVIIFAYQAVNGQVIHTDIFVTLNNPDTLYELDINQDGIYDYKITLDTQTFEGFDSCCFMITLVNYNNNSVASENFPEKSYSVVSLNENTTIDSTLTWEIYSYGSCMALGSHCYAWFWGDFRGVIDKFIGLKFSDATHTYYGWIRVDVAHGAEWITIKDFAYESNGDSIVTTLLANISPPAKLENNVLLYPNPAENNIVIVTQKYSEIEVFNIEGQIIKKFKTENCKTIIDLVNFLSGVYFIKSKTENGIAINKFIKL